MEMQGNHNFQLSCISHLV